MTTKVYIRCKHCGWLFELGESCSQCGNKRFHVMYEERLEEHFLKAFSDFESAKEYAKKMRQEELNCLVFKEQVCTYFVLDTYTAEITYVRG